MWLNTRGSSDTAAELGNLEQVPRRQIEYRGVMLEEMDTDANTRLSTDCCVSRRTGPHQRPWLEAGEALSGRGRTTASRGPRRDDHEHSAPRKPVRHHRAVHRREGEERVPDYVLAQGDQIVNVDVSAEDLQERLRHGKVYMAERVEKALANFFTCDNLSRLRELALEEIASALDRQRQKKGGPTDNGSDRIMLCLSSQPATRRCSSAKQQGSPTVSTPHGMRSMSKRLKSESRGWMRQLNGRCQTPWLWPSNLGASPCHSQVRVLRQPWPRLSPSTGLPTSSWDGRSDHGISAGWSDRAGTTIAQRTASRCHTGTAHDSWAMKIVPLRYCDQCG